MLRIKLHPYAISHSMLVSKKSRQSVLSCALLLVFSIIYSFGGSTGYSSHIIFILVPTIFHCSFVKVGALFIHLEDQQAILLYCSSWCLFYCDQTNTIIPQPFLFIWRINKLYWYIVQVGAFFIVIRQTQ